MSSLGPILEFMTEVNMPNSNVPISIGNQRMDTKIYVFGVDPRMDTRKDKSKKRLDYVRGQSMLTILDSMVFMRSDHLISMRIFMLIMNKRFI